jgi:hypothetical protein
MVVREKNFRESLFCVQHLKMLTTIRKLNVQQRSVWILLLLISSVFYFIFFFQSTNVFYQQVVNLLTCYINQLLIILIIIKCYAVLVGHNSRNYKYIFVPFSV